MDTENIMMEETGETSSLSGVQQDIKEETALGADKIQPEKGNIDFELKIIKEANCRIKVLDVEEATGLAKKIAAKYRGYVSDERFTNTNYSKENRFTIRVPQNNFDIVLDSICKTAEFVDFKNISTIDVTEEYVDITSRLKTKLEVKQRYETILRTKAKTVEDILMAEEKLSKLQEEIESAQGRLKYLGSKVTYSTIQLDIYETIIPKVQSEKYTLGFLDKAKKGLLFGWSVIEVLTLSLFYIWPLLILGIFGFIYFKWRRK
ncbi:hypothetical protein GCM10007384_17670 [Aquimarina muelleri]|uniref:DUF4349 domain-containing protein n=2 Tax=Aquimarina muelleri TaxID=279356 RepID=A0A918N3T4_9FLAO|nr:hypothetical protein GCM10007384_17670 [Aquimarina muelleri]